MPWVEILKRLDLLAFDLRRHLGLNLGDVLDTHSWRAFADLVTGLLSLERVVTLAKGTVTFPDTLLGAHFYHDDSEDTDG